MSVNIAAVGLGYWGPNLARNFASLKEANLHTICDLDKSRLDRFKNIYPAAKVTGRYEDVLNDRDVDAVELSTPISSHFQMAKSALEAGKSVLVEKPLATSTVDGQLLVDLAEAKGLTLMVGHVFLYNEAVRTVKRYIDSGELGEIYYIYAQRLNLGRVRNDANALWNFAPHDISIINYWLGSSPVHVNAVGHSYLQEGIEDVVFMNMKYSSSVAANIHISWLDPNKIRCMTVVGSEKMLVYDDVKADYRITIFDMGFSKKFNNAENIDKSFGSFETFGEFQLMKRAGDILIPKINFVEPLKTECEHFVNCIQNGTRPLTDGIEGLSGVATLEAAQKSMDGGGITVNL